MMNMSEGMPQGQEPQQDMSQNTIMPQAMPSEEFLLDTVSSIQERQTAILKDTGLSLDEMEDSMGKANKKMSQHEKNLVSEFEQNYLAVMEVSQMLGQSVPPFDIEDPNAKKNKKVKVKRKGGKGVQLKKNLKGDKGGINNGSKKYLKRLTSDMDSIRYMAKGGEMSMEEALVGENVTGIDQSMYNIPANAELEAGEYLQQPNGDVQKIQGKKHASGGEKMQLQNGTKVISDYLTLGAKNAKYYSKEYGIKVSAKDTYAKVVDKYTTKLGINKMNKEEESIIKKLKQEQEDTKDENTLMLNTDFLSRKLNDIEKKKAPLENLRTMMVDDVFNKQEMSKPKSERAESVGGAQQSFKKGGGFIDDSQVKALCKKYDIPYEKGLQLMQQYSKGGTEIDTYNKGGKKKYSSMSKYQPGGVYRPDQIEMLKKWERDARSRGFQGKLDYSGDIGAEAGKLQKFMSQNFPEVVERYFTDEKRPLTAKAMDMLKSSNPDIFKNLNLPEKGSAEYTFEEKELIKSKLKEDGLLTTDFLLEQFNDNMWDFRRPDFGLASDNIKSVGLQELDTDISETQITPQVTPEASTLEEEEDPVDMGYRTEAEIKYRNPMAFLALPDQNPMFPSSRQYHNQFENSLGRIDPSEVTAQSAINRINEQADMAYDAAYRQGDASSVLAQSAISNNAMSQAVQAETQANAMNADLENKAELVNIGKADQEGMLNNREAKESQRLNMIAGAKTEEDIRNYYDTLTDIQVSNYNTINKMNQINQLYDNFYIDANGNPVATNNGRDVLGLDLKTKINLGQV